MTDDTSKVYKPLVCHLSMRLVALWQRQAPKGVSILSDLLSALANLQLLQDAPGMNTLASMLLRVALDAMVFGQAVPPQLATMIWSVSELIRFPEVASAACLPAVWRLLQAELWTRDLDTFSNHEICQSAL